MTIYVPQRLTSDCSICCIAMVSGKTYEEVIEAAGDDFVPAGPQSGMWSVQKTLTNLGFNRDDFQELHRGYEISPEYFLGIAWGRRALISVPSLNKKGGWHHVYCDGTGETLFDPSTRKKYTHWDQLKPDELIIFREAIDKAPKAPDDWDNVKSA